MPLRNSWLPRWTCFSIAIIIGCAITYSISCGPIHNPDADEYYISAIRWADGRWWDGVYGLVGPLLPALLAGLLRFGIPLHWGYEITLIASLFCILTVTAIWCHRYLSSVLLVPCVLILVAIQTGGIQISHITGDILCTCFVVIALETLIRKRYFLSGILLSLAILSKPMICVASGMVAIVAIVFNSEPIPRKFRDSLCFLLGLAPLLGCWIWLIYEKYGIINLGISLQYSDLTRNNFDFQLEYWIDSPFKNMLSEIKASVSAPLPSYPTADPFLILPYLSIILRREWELYGSSENFLGFIILFFIGSFYILVVERGSIRVLVLFLLTIVLAQMSFGAERIRYFMPALPIAILVIFRTIELASRRHKILGHVAAFSFFALISISGCRVLATKVNMINQDVVSRILSSPVINKTHGRMAGRYLDLYAGYVAGALNREYLGKIRPEVHETCVDINRRLLKWDVELVLWVGEPHHCLRDLEQYAVIETFETNTEQVSILLNRNSPFSHRLQDG